jgi:hypothetical protein
MVRQQPYTFKPQTKFARKSGSCKTNDILSLIGQLKLIFSPPLITAQWIGEFYALLTSAADGR